MRQDCVDSERDHKSKPVSQGGMACESESGEGMPVCLSFCQPAKSEAELGPHACPFSTAMEHSKKYVVIWWA
jgi:hypothetical protein